MLDLNQLKDQFNKHPRFLAALSAGLVLGLLFLLVFSPRPKTTPLPPFVTLTSTPSPVQSSRETPPSTVDLSRAKNDVSVEKTSTYVISPDQPFSLNVKDLAAQLNLPSDPEIINTQFIQVNTWRGPDYYLNHNLLAHQIIVALNDENKVAKTGRFDTPQDLFIRTTNLINSLQVFSPKIKFWLERFSYLTSGQEPELADASTGRIIEIILTPQIEGLSVYQREIPFVSASYDRSNKLVKLTITNPIPSFEQKETFPLVKIDEVQTRSTNQFFRLFVKPTTNEELFLRAPDIKDLIPSRLWLGLYLENSVLSPVYLLESNDFLYATSATN